MQEYVSALIFQLSSYGKILNATKVDSIYFGGGTPTLLSERQFDEIFSAIHANFQIAASNTEQCIEGCPITVRESSEKIRHLKNLGINRFSMGVQSFHDDELKSFGRSHRQDNVLCAVDVIRASDIRFLNLDLIYGLKGQDRDKWINNLDRLMSFSPETATLYPLNIRKNTKMHDDANNSKDFNRMFSLYDETTQYMKQHNYNHDTYVLFSKEGNFFGYKQQEKEFQCLPMLGLGIAARSYLDGFQYSSYDTTICTSERIHEYINRVRNNPFYAERGHYLDLDQQMRRFIILGLLDFNHGVDVLGFYRKFQKNLLDVFMEEIEWLLSKHFISITDKNLLFTETGRKFSNFITELL